MDKHHETIVDTVKNHFGADSGFFVFDVPRDNKDIVEATTRINIELPNHIFVTAIIKCVFSLKKDTEIYTTINIADNAFDEVTSIVLFDAQEDSKVVFPDGIPTYDALLKLTVVTVCNLFRRYTDKIFSNILASTFNVIMDNGIYNIVKGKIENPLIEWGKRT